MTEKRRRLWIQILRIGMLVLGAAFVVWGLVRQEHLEVMVKAIRICLECIGIG